MRLKAFRIRDYRSIIDTGWCYTPNDNITVLIGQNESGKTTVLEALQSFHDGIISEDILRSDLSMPKVYCTFEVNNQNMEDIIDFERVPEEVLKTINNLKSISISRAWSHVNNSTITIEEEALRKVYHSREKEKEKILKQSHKKLNETLGEYSRISQEREEIQKEIKQVSQQMGELNSTIHSRKKALNRGRKKKNTDQLREQLKGLEKKLENAQKKYQELQKQDEQLQKELGQIDEAIYAIAKQVEETENQFNAISEEVEEKKSELKDYQAEFNLLVNEKDKRMAQHKIDQLQSHYKNLLQNFEEKRKEKEFWLQVSSRVLQGEDSTAAEVEVRKQRRREESYYDLDTLGQTFFTSTPVFEFFHDFSSLLPTRIDLEDIIYEKSNVEGYKAVENYLRIANLRPDFFNQPNSRILKQKIENLNNEITVDFHEYWRQQVGTNNKINITFDLEHYDQNNPEKAGKPYIEFWIKDKDERLYPKQRSRGVRWFLSFYLELKAFAKRNNRHRVLLIDEPALSLHARAQEDVLKVFEDIKDDLQIMYTTHSPHLINVHKLYRILALQRADEREYSETVIFDPASLKVASSDTLSPIYVLMGARLNDQKFIQKQNNIIVEDIASYYFFDSIHKLMGLKEEMHFLPASNISNITTLANLLLGWKLGFSIILGNHEEGHQIYDYFRYNLYQNDDEKTRRHILVLEQGMKQAEDLFSTLDFKKYILNKRVGITESNSSYIEHNNVARPILASNFLATVQNENLTLDDFDEETRENLTHLAEGMKQMIRNQASLREVREEVGSDKK
ncbi:MAG TPA: AAA family ATPase [Bacteroidales bacterium]|nr:AAA family ATPase [Bacteroidales bacterium]